MNDSEMQNQRGLADEKSQSQNFGDCISREKILKVLHLKQLYVALVLRNGDVPEQRARDYKRGYSQALDFAKSVIRSAPAVSSSFEKHGYWGRCLLDNSPVCSECKIVPQCYITTKYCPNCGAKMGGKRDKNG